MSGEWTPGDVAIRFFDGKKSLSMVVECNQHQSGGPHWHHSDGGWDLMRYASAPIQSMATYRPLMVIDPDDAESVARLADLIPNCGDVENHCDPQQCMSMGCWVDRVSTALREFANPTPPKREVLEHVVLQKRGKTAEALCGKAWIPDPDVNVLGRCPECSEIVRAGWLA